MGWTRPKKRKIVETTDDQVWFIEESDDLTEGVLVEEYNGPEEGDSPFDVAPNNTYTIKEGQDYEGITTFTIVDDHGHIDNVS